MDQNGAIPSLAVQVVLFEHQLRSIEKLAASLGPAIARVRHDALIGEVSVLMGDSSPEPALTDGEVESLRTSLVAAGVHRFDYFFFARNRGSAGGNNDLFAEAGSDLVAIINPDCYADPRLLAELCRGMDDAVIGIVEGRQLPLEHPKEFDRQTGDTSWASGACMLVRREVIMCTGGFDEANFFMYCDDVDFSWRTRLAGYRVVYQPTARVFHDKRLDPQGQVEAGEAEVYFSAEAALMMAWKYARPDLVEKWSAGLVASGLPAHAKAVEAFEERRARGDLPQPLDPEGHVAQFVGYNYAAHRFLYDE